MASETAPDNLDGARLHNADAFPPALACDSHMHIYGDGTAATAASPHARADVASYLRLRERLGLARVVVVTPSAHGLDNSLTLSAIARFGTMARGVAVIGTDCSDAELKRLDAGGIRGVRANFVQRGATTVEMLESLARRIAGLNWHLQLNLSPPMLDELKGRLLALPVPIVLDHMARLDSVENQGYAALRRMLESGRVWIKLSGAYLIDRGETAARDRLQILVRRLIEQAPERLVWGSNWPHPTHHQLGLDLPDDAALLDRLGEWAGRQRDRERILVENPQQLYDFEPQR